MNKFLEQLGIDYLLVNSTNKYLVEYPLLSENARYTLTGFSGSTGDALITMDKIYLFVDGRYHIQAEQEAKKSVTIVKLEIGQKQDDEIRKLLDPNKVLGIVSKKVSQQRLEGFKYFRLKLLDKDPINDYTELHLAEPVRAFESVNYFPKSTYITDLEEVSYITGLRDFSRDNSSKIWSKMFIDKPKYLIFKNDYQCENFLKNYDKEIFVDKSLINAYEYSLIKHPVHKPSEIKQKKSIKSAAEIDAYKKAFERTDKALLAVRKYIENNDNITEYDIARNLRKEFTESGAKCLSFNPIVAINKNSASAHYSKSSDEVVLDYGDLVLIDCGAYYESGLATDITRVFVKGNPSELQKMVYTTVLKTFLNCYNYNLKDDTTGYDIDTYAHSLIDNVIKGFKFNHGLGHGIGINVHEAPPNLSQNEIAKGENGKIKDGMCFTIEPGLYNPEKFGIRLENSCYCKDRKIHSFTKMGFERKLIDYDLLSEQETIWLREFMIL